MALESVVLTGQVSPADVAHLLDGEDARWAADTVGYRGIPVSSLASALVEAGMRVEAVTTAQEVDAPRVAEGPSFRLLVAPMRSRARDRAADMFRRERRHLGALLGQTDGPIVHANWTYEFAWAALGDGRPVVVTAHDAPLTILRHHRDVYRGVRTAMAYIVRARARHMTAVSPYLAARWKREMLYWGDVRVIPNITPRLPRVARNGNSRTPLVVDVSDAGPRKNVGALLSAVHQLRSSGRDVELALAGSGLGPDGPLAQSAQGSADEGVRWMGLLTRPELAALYQDTTVFVHTSREESFGLSVIEAMSCGLPVIGGDRSGAIPWLLENGRAGMLVDVEEPKSVSDAIAAVLDDRELAARLGARARERATEFSPARVAEAYIDEYERVGKAARA